MNITPIKMIYILQTVFEMSKWSDEWSILLKEMSSIT